MLSESLKFAIVAVPTLWVSYAVALLLSAASLGVYYSDLITTALEARRAARARQIELVAPKADAC